MRLVIHNSAALKPDPDGRVQQYIDAQVIKECEPYVPFREGILAGSARVARGGGAVEYTAPYARRHYYNTGGVDSLGRRYGPSKFTGAPLPFFSLRPFRYWQNAPAYAILNTKKTP